MTTTIEARQRIERKIARRVVLDALRLGYTLSVDDGEEVTVKKSTSVKAIMAALMTTDEDYLHLHKANQPKGWVRFVYGNDGWDVICDYAIHIEDAVAGANALADKLSE